MIGHHFNESLVFKKLNMSSSSYHLVNIMFADLEVDVESSQFAFSIFEDIGGHLVMQLSLGSFFIGFLNSGTFKRDIIILVTTKENGMFEMAKMTIIR